MNFFKTKKLPDGVTREQYFEKYRNPDSRCLYPFTPDELGYCWGFAHAVDEDRKMDGRGCSAHCEYWNGNEDMPMPWHEDYKRKHAEWWKNRGKK